MSCKRCGRSCNGRVCQDCERELNQDTQPVGRREWPDCPTCDGTTIAPGVRCRECREADKEALEA